MESSEQKTDRWFKEGMTLQERVDYLLKENKRLRQENAKLRQTQLPTVEQLVAQW